MKEEQKFERPRMERIEHRQGARVGRTGIFRLQLLLFLAALIAGFLPGECFPAPTEKDFIRGDSNDDGEVNISDAVCTIWYLFGDPGPSCGSCRDALDSDDDGKLEINDVLFLLNFLFLDGSSIAFPYPDCGPDPTAEDLVDCAIVTHCIEFDGFTFVVEPDLELLSIWSEGYDTAPEQHAVLSKVRFREGIHRFFAGRDTEGLNLIQALFFGPDLIPATPAGSGTFIFHSGQYYSYLYRQSFETASGIWTFHLSFRPGDGRVETLDCDFLEGNGDAMRSLPLFAEFDGNKEKKNIHYSCFSSLVWSTAGQSSPRRMTFDDGMTLEVELEQSYLFRGVAGETSNRCISRASVGFGGEEFEVLARERLIYAALHHNVRQEFRILFDPQRDGIYGVDVVECPPEVISPFCGVPTVGVSEAYLLNEALERTTKLTVTDFQIGK